MKFADFAASAEDAEAEDADMATVDRVAAPFEPPATTSGPSRGVAGPRTPGSGPRRRLRGHRDGRQGLWVRVAVPRRPRRPQTADHRSTRITGVRGSPRKAQRECRLPVPHGRRGKRRARSGRGFGRRRRAPGAAGGPREAKRATRSRCGQWVRGSRSHRRRSRGRRRAAGRSPHSATTHRRFGTDRVKPGAPWSRT